MPALPDCTDPQSRSGAATWDRAVEEHRAACDSHGHEQEACQRVLQHREDQAGWHRPAFAAVVQQPGGGQQRGVGDERGKEERGQNRDLRQRQGKWDVLEAVGLSSSVADTSAIKCELCVAPVVIRT
jgi:hypothetical protein